GGKPMSRSRVVKGSAVAFIVSLALWATPETGNAARSPTPSEKRGISSDVTSFFDLWYYGGIYTARVHFPNVRVSNVHISTADSRFAAADVVAPAFGGRSKFTGLLILWRGTRKRALASSD